MYDPSYKSCTSYICDMAKQKWGFTAPDLDDLVYWANIIDGAQYPDAKTAVELGAPAMKLTLVMEGSQGFGDGAANLSGYMQRMPLAEIVRTAGNSGGFQAALRAPSEIGRDDLRAGQRSRAA